MTRHSITFRPHRLFVVAVPFAMMLSAAGLQAQDEEAPKPPTPPVAAWVNEEPIYVGEVEAGISDSMKLRQVNREGIGHARARMLNDIIDKRVIAQSLEEDGTYLDPAALEKQMHKLESRMKENRTTLEKFAAQRGVGVETARQELAWPMIWGRYLERHLADEIEGYFNEHRKELDGTEVRVSHILLRPDGIKESKQQVARRAEKIREQIESKKLTFEQAAEKYSAGPSRAKWGDLGFVPRFGLLADEFTRVAFSLKEYEVSQPVTTNFGTHIITVTDIKPGKKQWTDVIPLIQPLAAKLLFTRLAHEHRKDAKIEFTGLSPYFKPGTEELAIPESGG